MVCGCGKTWKAKQKIKIKYTHWWWINWWEIEKTELNSHSGSVFTQKSCCGWWPAYSLIMKLCLLFSIGDCYTNRFFINSLSYKFSTKINDLEGAQDVTRRKDCRGKRYFDTSFLLYIHIRRIWHYYYCFIIVCNKPVNFSIHMHDHQH